MCVIGSRGTIPLDFTFHLISTLTSSSLIAAERSWIVIEHTTIRAQISHSGNMPCEAQVPGSQGLDFYLVEAYVALRWQQAA